MEKKRTPSNPSQKPVTPTVTATQMKEKVKDYFIRVEEDKFTKTKTVKCKESIDWTGANLARLVSSPHKEEAMFIRGVGQLKMLIEYRHRDEEDAVVFMFVSSNYLGYFGMSNLKLYLILDNEKTIELHEVVGHTVDSTNVYGLVESFDTQYVEIAALALSVAQLIDIVNVSKIDFSIRTKEYNFEGTLSPGALTLLKGFYNNTFDEEFEIERLYRAISIAKPATTVKSSGADSKSGGGGCYVATMAYGHYEHPQVKLLRNFRDEVLQKSHLGRAFVRSYQKHSPKLVRQFENHPGVNSIIRHCLDFIVEILKTRE